MSDDYPGGWFGANWGAPVCEGEHFDTPIDDPCMHCHKPIKPDDRGLIVPNIDKDHVWLDPIHLACMAAWTGVDR